MLGDRSSRLSVTNATSSEIRRSAVRPSINREELRGDWKHVVEVEIGEASRFKLSMMLLPWRFDLREQGKHKVQKEALEQEVAMEIIYSHVTAPQAWLR